MKAKTKSVLALLITAVILVCEVISFIMMAGTSVGDMFRYYTEISNNLTLLVCAALIVFGIRRIVRGTEIPGWLHGLQYLCVCMMMLTFLVVILILMPMVGPDMKGGKFALLSGAMFYRHLFCPLLLLLEFLAFERKPRLSGVFRSAFTALIPTIVYGIVIIALVANSLCEPPYPFLSALTQPWYVTLMWIAIIGAAFVALAAAIAWLQRLQRTKA